MSTCCLLSIFRNKKLLNQEYIFFPVKLKNSYITRMSDNQKDKKEGESSAKMDAGSEKQHTARMSDDQKDKKEGESSAWKDAGWFALKTAAISGAVLGGGALLLPAVGFTAGGVAAGSWAAGFQSAYLGGTIASGSTFAVLQSVGAAGLAASTQAAVVAGSAVVAGAHSISKKIKRNNETDNGNISEEAIKNDEDEEAGENDGKREIPKKISKNNNLPVATAGSTKNDSRGENKKLPVKLVLSYRNDDPNNSSKLNTPPLENEDELDALRKKWEDIELSKDLTITQHLIKK